MHTALCRWARHADVDGCSVNGCSDQLLEPHVHPNVHPDVALYSDELELELVDANGLPCLPTRVLRTL